MLDPQSLAQQAATRLSNVNARIFGVPTLKVWSPGDYVDWEKDDCTIRCQLNNHIVASFSVPDAAMARFTRREILEKYGLPAFAPFKQKFDAAAKRVIISAPLIERKQEGREHSRAQSNGLHVSVTMEHDPARLETNYTMETLFGAFQV